MEVVDQHFNNLLHKIAKEYFVNYNLDVKPIQSGGANYTSKLYQISITEGSNVLNLFAKVAAIGEKYRSQAPRLYLRERFFYTKLVKIYEKLQEEHQISDEDKLAFPKFYGCNPNIMEETIVLENLVVEGYKDYNRFKSIDWPYASSAVKELAKMHAMSFAHEKYYPENFEEIIEIPKCKWNFDKPHLKVYMNNMIAKALEVTREENRDKLKRFVDSGRVAELAAIYNASRRVMLGHGDYRPSNLMHKYLDDGKVDIKIVDLQTLQSGSPVTDLIYFIFTGSDEQFRAQYYDKLVAHYYTQLSESMKRLHLNPDEIYSRDDFDFELKEKLPFGLCLAIFTLPVITVKTEDAPQVNENLNLSTFTVENTNDVYVERLNGVINDYVKWGILK